MKRQAYTGEIKALSEEARGQLTLACLLQLTIAAKKQTDVVTWRRAGGFELEDFVDALERGGRHPLLQKWEKRKAENASDRLSPTMRGMHARRLAVLMSMALQRTKVMGATKARRRAAEALAEIDVFATPVTVKHWEQRLDPPFAEEDERVIANALARCGENTQALTDHFIGLVQFAGTSLLPIGPKLP
jgi:hypothetical protein